MGRAACLVLWLLSGGEPGGLTPLSPAPSTATTSRPAQPPRRAAPARSQGNDDLLPVRFEVADMRSAPLRADPDLRQPFGPHPIPTRARQPSAMHLGQTIARHDPDIRDPFARRERPPVAVLVPPQRPAASPQSDLVDPFDPAAPQPRAASRATQGPCAPQSSGGVRVQLPRAVAQRCARSTPRPAAPAGPTSQLVDPFAQPPTPRSVQIAPPSSPATVPAGDLADPFAPRSRPVRGSQTRPAPFPGPAVPLPNLQPGASAPGPSGGVSPARALSPLDPSV